MAYVGLECFLGDLSGKKDRVWRMPIKLSALLILSNDVCMTDYKCVKPFSIADCAPGLLQSGSRLEIP